MPPDINIHLIATEIGEHFKWDTTLNQIDRYGRALFRIEPGTFPNPAISSQRAQRIHDWILSAARQEMPHEKRVNLIRIFCHKLADEKPERCQKLDKIMLGGGFTLPQGANTQENSENSVGHASRSAQERAHARQKLESLLAWFDELVLSQDEQRRGYHLQDLLSQTLALYSLPIVKPFTRNDGGEQIDGGFKLEGWHYLVECRWRKKPADIRDLDGMRGQLERSGKQTLGLFLSINGWSPNVAPLLKQNPSKSIILMEGADLRAALTGVITLPELVSVKAAKLSFEGEPYYSAAEHLGTRCSG